MTTKSYEDGVRDGKIEALETIAGKHEKRMDGHDKRMDSHSSRIRGLEKVMWAVAGAVAVIQLILPVAVWAFDWAIGKVAT